MTKPEDIKAFAIVTPDGKIPGVLPKVPVYDPNIGAVFAISDELTAIKQLQKAAQDYSPEKNAKNKIVEVLITFPAPQVARQKAKSKKK